MKPARLAALVLSAAACGTPAAPSAGDEPAPKAPQPPPAPAPASTRITECPRSLGGLETGIDRVISKDCGPVNVVEDYRIDGGTLTLEAGAVLQFKDGAGLVVGPNLAAKLVIAGTPGEPVTLTSATDRTAGAWRGIELHRFATGSQIAGAVIEFAGDEARALLVAATEVSITGTTVQETRGPALRLEAGAGLTAFADNTLRKLGSKAAIVAAPAAMANLAGANRFDAGAVVQVDGGLVDTPTVWPNPGVPLLLAEELRVATGGHDLAEIRLSPGTELQFAAGGRLVLGGPRPGRLRAHGSADAPITFTAAERREPGGWGGVQVSPQGEVDVHHAAFEFAGDDGALAVDGGALALREVTFRSNRAGVVVRGPAKIEALADNRFAATPRALDLPPALVGALGEGNAFDAEARIVVQPGVLVEQTTWAAHGAPLELAGELTIAAELTLEAGLRVLARPEAQLVVGGDAAGVLLARGTIDAPIELGPAAGSWRGIKLRAQSAGSILRHVTLIQTGRTPGVWVDAGGEVRLDNVTCSKCQAAVVGWACGAKVSQSAVLAADGTPAIDAPPTGC